MIKKSFIFVFFIVIAYTIKAQVKTVAKPGLFSHFHSFNTVQVLRGTTTTSFAVNTTNGFQFGKFFTGIGTGVDYYFRTSIPLLVETRIDLIKQKRTLQLFVNGGVNFAFGGQNEGWEFTTGSYKPGSMYAGGVDYIIPVKKEAIILGASFSNKHVIYMVDNNIWNPVLNRTENIPTKENYSLNRIALRVGWMF